MDSTREARGVFSVSSLQLNRLLKPGLPISTPLWFPLHPEAIFSAFLPLCPCLLPVMFLSLSLGAWPLPWDVSAVSIPHNPGVCSPLPSRLLLGPWSPSADSPSDIHWRACLPLAVFFWGGGAACFLLYFSSGHLTPKSLFIYMLSVCLPS